MLFCFYLCVCMCIQVPVEARRGHQMPKASVLGSCKLPMMGARNQNLVLYKSSPCSELLTLFFSPYKFILKQLFVPFVYILIWCFSVLKVLFTFLYAGPLSGKCLANIFIQFRNPFFLLLNRILHVYK